MSTPHIVSGLPSAPPERPTPSPSRSVSSPKPAAKQAEDGGNLRVLTYLQLHWLKIVFCGMLLGGVGAYAAWELLATKYESTALLRVKSAPAALANQNRNDARTDFMTYLKTTSALIKSDFVLNAALRDLKDSPTIKSQKDPIKYLEEELLVTCPDGSEVIRVTFKSHDAADARRIVDAVQKAFMSEVIQKEVQDMQQFVNKVETAMVAMRKILDGRVEGTQKASAKPSAGSTAMVGPPPGGAQGAGAATPLPPVAPGVQPPVNGDAANPAVAVGQPGFDLSKIDPRILIQKVAQLQAAQEELPLLINEENRRLTALQQRMEEIKKAPPSEATLSAIEKDPELLVLVAKTRFAKHEWDFRRGTSANENAPAVVELRQVYEAYEAKLAQLRKDKIELLERDRRTLDLRNIAVEMDDVKRRLERSQEKFKFNKDLLAQSEKQLAEIPLPNGKGLGSDGKDKPFDPDGTMLEGTNMIYMNLVRQYYLTKMELDAPARVSLVQSASNPTQKDTKKQVIGTVFAALMGFGLMALGVIAFETLTKRVSTLSDVKGSSNLSVVGVIPCLPGEAVGKDPVKRAAANEAIDKLRTYVAQTWLARGATTIAVTSPLGEEGKAFTAFGLASSLAQSGYKTLIVDFDLRDPQLHLFTGVENLNGVCELLRAETDPRSAIQFLPSGLQLLPAGKWSDEARKAATGERLESLLARLRGPYDCVVIHSHALLTAAESVEVARRCEVVLVCAQYRETTMPLLKRAAERIASMEIPYSGVVYLGASEQEALC